MHDCVLDDFCQDIFFISALTFHVCELVLVRFRPLHLKVWGVIKFRKKVQV